VLSSLKQGGNRSVANGIRLEIGEKGAWLQSSGRYAMVSRASGSRVGPLRLLAAKHS